MPESMVVIVTEKELLGTQPRARHGSHRSRDGCRSPPKERPSLFDPPAHRDRRRAKGAKGARVPSSIRRPRRHVLSNSDRTILPPLPTKKAEASGAGGGSRRGWSTDKSVLSESLVWMRSSAPIPNSGEYVVEGRVDQSEPATRKARREQKKHRAQGSGADERAAGGAREHRRGCRYRELRSQ
eukprot:COSAG04_NODE_11374_length_713_cov_0.622150_1_plen_182_part_01